MLDRFDLYVKISIICVGDRSQWTTDYKNSAFNQFSICNKTLSYIYAPDIIWPDGTNDVLKGKGAEVQYI